MTTARKHPQESLDELSRTVRGMNQSLCRLVELGESFLDALDRSPQTTSASAGREIRHSTTARPIGCSTRSENSTADGVIDLLQEEPITFREARLLIPSDPHPSVSTISRWCTAGCRGTKLESFYVGGRRKTTREAVERFLRACRKQNWVGMHDTTAFELEQAMTKKDLRDAQQPAEPQPVVQAPRIADIANRNQKSRSRTGRGANRYKNKS